MDMVYRSLAFRVTAPPASEPEEEEAIKRRAHVVTQDDDWDGGLPIPD